MSFAMRSILIVALQMSNIIIFNSQPIQYIVFFSFSFITSLDIFNLNCKNLVRIFKMNSQNLLILYLFKVFRNHIILLITTNLTTVLSNGESILNCIFDAMVLTVGIDELTNVKHVDRLKKEIRPCYLLVDEILKSVECLENQSNLYLLSLTEVIPNISNNILQEKLYEWSESISSLFCCLIMKNKIVVASSAWWDLTAIEKNLLSLLVAVNSNCTTADIPVFLPIKSPKIAFRFISCCLISDIWVSALCGPTPSIIEFENSAAICWSPVIEYLKEISFSVPQIIPENMNIQNGITGLMVIDYRIGKYVLLGSIVNNKVYFEILKIFYYQNIKENNLILIFVDKHNNHKVNETYWYSENYKLYGLISDPHILCLMTSSVVPTSSARLISKDMLTSIINNKLFVCRK
ncbi:hypothetical protein PGB90_007899 [Kerria lacca]